MAVFFFVEQDGMPGEEAVPGCVSGGGGFAFRGAGAGRVLGIGLIGFDLRGGGDFVFLLFVFEMQKGGRFLIEEWSALTVLVWHGFGVSQRWLGGKLLRAWGRFLESGGDSRKGFAFEQGYFH